MMKDSLIKDDEKNDYQYTENDQKWIEAKMPGFLSKNWPLDKRHVVDLGGIMNGPLSCAFWCTLCMCGPCRMAKGTINPTIKVHNARLFEKEEGLTKAEFFEKHGFVLLEHATEMKEEYWVLPEAVYDIYHEKEIVPLIREKLFPNKKIKKISFGGGVLRRGPGTSSPFYGLAVHGDYGIGPDEFEKNLRSTTNDYGADKWRKEYEKKDTSGYIMINFWRPCLPMKGPVKKIPLAVCDVSTVEKEDIIKKHLLGFQQFGKLWNTSLKFNENQKWCYYPNMTVNETLVFKQFVCMKDDPDAYKMQCFHSAFNDPTTPPNSETRQSCEYRVPIFFEK